MEHFEDVLRAVSEQPRRRVAVAGAAGGTTLAALSEASSRALVEPVLVGDERVIRAQAEREGLDLVGISVVAVAGGDEAVSKAAVAEVREGRADLLMKGGVGTATLMHAVLHREWGLRAGRRLSHVATVEHPGFPKLMLHTDGGVNHAPDERTWRDMTANAVGLARSLGRREVRVACLALAEKLDPNMPVTAAMAALAAWAGGEWPDVVAEGPMGLDMALSEAAARLKGKASRVAGRADVFVHPSITACNFTVKALYGLADARVAGLVLGARVPIVLLSRADSAETRRLSLALAAVTLAE